MKCDTMFTCLCLLQYNELMTKFLMYAILFSFCFSCEMDSLDKKVENLLYQVKEHEYTEMNIPSFFEKLVDNHKVDYYQFALEEYQRFCSDNNVAFEDEANKDKYFTIRILHDLFTSQSAQNCATGQAWNIPYYWHWVDNNPRHRIYLKESGELLKNIKPDKEFSKYHSKADVDRTPYLFLKDLFSETPKYSSKDCGDFSTFGWCSEREMAFVSMLTLLGHQGKVAAQGGHSWTELIVDMKLTNGKNNHFKVSVDNTFDKITWDLISKGKIDIWETEMGDSKTKKWYNKKALSKTEQDRISSFQVSSKVMTHLERKFVSYLNRKI